MNLEDGKIGLLKKLKYKTTNQAMKVIKGKILITDKVIFVYYELPKPEKANYSTRNNYLSFQKAMKKYEASKRTVEVSNTYSISVLNSQNAYILIDEKTEFIKHNNQPCKAEVNGTATIIELL